MFDPKTSRQMGLAITVISELTFIVLVGGGVGYWLDLTLKTTPSFTLTLSILALVFGFKKLIHHLQQADSDHDHEPPESGSP